MTTTYRPPTEERAERAAPPALRPAPSGPSPPRRPGPLAAVAAAPWSRSLALLVVFGLLTWAGLLQLATPDPRPAGAPATEFSAERALQHLRVLAADSRAVGTQGHAAARQYLVDQLRALGLQPEVQTATAIQRFAGADTSAPAQSPTWWPACPGQRTPARSPSTPTTTPAPPGRAPATPARAW